MPHENVSNDTEAEKAAKRIENAYRKLEAIVNGDDDLIVEANKRTAIRKAAKDAKKVYREHRIPILIVETLLVVITFGVMKIRRHKSS